MDNSVQKKYNLNFFGRESGDVLLFANGYGCDLSMWRYIVPAFREKYRIVLYDHIGSGRSDLSLYSSERYSGLSAYSEDMIEIAKALESDRIHIIAHSVSSMIGGLASIREPDLFKSLVMIGPSACYMNSEDGSYTGGFSRDDLKILMESLDNNYLGWASAIAPVIMGNPDRPELSSELTNIFCRNNPEIAKHFARVTFFSDIRSDLGSIPIKCYIIQSEVDSIASVEVGQFVADNIPDSEFHLIEAYGHCPHLSHPELVIQKLHEFGF